MKHFAPHGPVLHLPAKPNLVTTKKVASRPKPEPPPEQGVEVCFVDQGGNFTLGLLAGLALDAFLDRYEK
jgi:hypothetical protein